MNMNREFFDKAHELLIVRYPSYMKLNIFVDIDEVNFQKEMNNKYIEAAHKHNNNILNNQFIDAGFDVFLPFDCEFYDVPFIKLDFNIKCSAQIYTFNSTNPDLIYNSGFYMYPRSSISKTSLRMANSLGIIDSGYRGNLIGAFDVLHCHQPTTLKKHDRVVQICAPGLIPIIVDVVDSIDKLGDKTSRGSGGFGSTGV
jgi:hypothetical protein